MALQLSVIISCGLKGLINPISNPKPCPEPLHTRDNITRARARVLVLDVKKGWDCLGLSYILRGVK
jgi:hypothetical protein